MAAPTPNSLRVVIVTGAGGQGCGRAIAARFAADGAAVVVGDIDEAGGRSTVELIEVAGGRAVFSRTDVRRDDEARALIAFAEATFGGLHVLVNNASTPVGGTNLDDWTTRWKQISLGQSA